MFHVDIREDFHVATEQFAVAEGLMCGSLDHPLIREPCACGDVYTDEFGRHCRRNCQRTCGLVPQYIDSQRQIERTTHFSPQRSQECDGVRRYASGIERDIAEILQ